MIAIILAGKISFVHRMPHWDSFNAVDPSIGGLERIYNLNSEHASNHLLCHMHHCKPSELVILNRRL